MSNYKTSAVASGLMTAGGERTGRLIVYAGEVMNVSLAGTFSGTVSLLRKLQPGATGPLSSGAHTGANNVSILTQAAAGWTVDELIGKYVLNETDGSIAYIGDNDATTVTGTLDGGTGDDWDTDDVWSLWEVRATYTAVANPQPTYVVVEDGEEYMLAFTTYSSGKVYGRLGKCPGYRDGSLV